VETAAADTLFSLAQYQQAMDLADHLIRTRPDLDPSLSRTAYVILGHGAFELGQYASAERSYRSLLAIPAVIDGRRRDQRKAAGRDLQAGRGGRAEWCHR
jgi:tetratricopeptide (TPR) repeat protein